MGNWGTRVDYTSTVTGRTWPMRSIVEANFGAYLDVCRNWWLYEPERYWDPAGSGDSWLADFWVRTKHGEVFYDTKYRGYLTEEDRPTIDDLCRRMQFVWAKRPGAHLALLPWHYGWTWPHGPWLVNHGRGWLYVSAGGVTAPWQPNPTGHKPQLPQHVAVT